MEKMEVGQKFSHQTGFIATPHLLEGSIYFGPCSDVCMFVQVEYAKFAMISLKSGNRICDPVQMKAETRPELGGVSEREVLKELNSNLGDGYIYQGKFCTDFDFKLDRY